MTAQSYGWNQQRMQHWRNRLQESGADQVSGGDGVHVLIGGKVEAENSEHGARLGQQCELRKLQTSRARCAYAKIIATVNASAYRQLSASKHGKSTTYLTRYVVCRMTFLNTTRHMSSDVLGCERSIVCAELVK